MMKQVHPVSQKSRNDVSKIVFSVFINPKKHEWQVEFNLTEPINNMKRLDISVSGIDPKEERRLFRFERDAYYREIYKWFLKDGAKYFDGRCGDLVNLGNADQDEVNAFQKACKANQWKVFEIRNGTEPKFFGIMDGFLYPMVSKIFLIQWAITGHIAASSHHAVLVPLSRKRFPTRI